MMSSVEECPGTGLLTTEDCAWKIKHAKLLWILLLLLEDLFELQILKYISPMDISTYMSDGHLKLNTPLRKSMVVFPKVGHISMLFLGWN